MIAGWVSLGSTLFLAFLLSPVCCSRLNDARDTPDFHLWKLWVATLHGKGYFADQIKTLSWGDFPRFRDCLPSQRSWTEGGKKIKESRRTCDLEVKSYSNMQKGPWTRDHSKPRKVRKDGNMVSFYALNEIQPLQHLDFIFVVCRAEREQICPAY